MGFFSWKTCDTDETVWNSYTGICRPVYLLMPKGKNIVDFAYDGYGRIAEHDVFVLLAVKNKLINTSTNKPCSFKDDFEEVRKIGLEFYFSDDDYAKAKFQIKLSFNPNAKYSNFEKSEDDSETQGFFGWKDHK